MKNSFLPSFFMLALLMVSCQHDEVKLTLDDYILAGQKTGNGIVYTDPEPDIICTIVDPWAKTDTLINLDLNHDGINDFTLHGSMCHPSMLGADCESVSIVPLMDNEICINPATTWADTLVFNDSIGIRNNFANNEALIYSYFWQMGGTSSNNGYWRNVFDAGKYFIGFKIAKDEKAYYGWIGMNRDTTGWGLNYRLTDYAVLKEYAK